MEKEEETKTKGRGPESCSPAVLSRLSVQLSRLRMSSSPLFSQFRKIRLLFVGFPYSISINNEINLDNFISYHRNSRYPVRQRRRDCICTTSCLFHVAMCHSAGRTPGSVLSLPYVAYIRLENIQRVYIVHCTAHFTVLCTVKFLQKSIDT